MLGEKSLSEKDKYQMISLTHGNKKKQRWGEETMTNRLLTRKQTEGFHSEVREWVKQLLGIKQCTWDELRVTCGRVALYWTPETNTTLCLHSLEFKLKDNIRLMTPTY